MSITHLKDIGLTEEVAARVINGAIQKDGELQHKSFFSLILFVLIVIPLALPALLIISFLIEGILIYSGMRVIGKRCVSIITTRKLTGVSNYWGKKS